MSSGKRLLASALLTKGVECPEDATFKQIYDAILRIPQQVVIGVERVPGEISYDYHYHKDGRGNTVHDNEVALDQQGGCFTVDIKHSHTGSAANGGGCYTVPVYHKHTGSTSGGGCYTTPIVHQHTSACYTAHEHTSACVSGSRTVKDHGCVLDNPANSDGWPGGKCGCGCYYEDHSGIASCGNPRCPQCYCPTHQEPVYGNCNNAKNKLGCGKTAGVTIDGYSLGCGMNESTIVGYDLGCGMEGKTVGYSAGCGLNDGQIVGAHIVYNK